LDVGAFSALMDAPPAGLVRRGERSPGPVQIEVVVGNGLRLRRIEMGVIDRGRLGVPQGGMEEGRSSGLTELDEELTTRPLHGPLFRVEVLKLQWASSHSRHPSV